ncbi:hypothetical protein NDU88_004788 [Pleurodeles waltl]|uniref:Uncharacterized protein n=1 Tax=Pleurodeles waltl TaxID=8319 RepID=A0AAV7TS77_PLEWA|nr:hypothetical protein NDU88_004788 [Pleurodeles waltl]
MRRKPKPFTKPEESSALLRKAWASRPRAGTAGRGALNPCMLRSVPPSARKALYGQIDRREPQTLTQVRKSSVLDKGEICAAEAGRALIAAGSVG